MRVKCFFDGNCSLGKRGAGAAIVYNEGGEELARKATYIEGEDVTANICEWRGLINTFELATSLGADRVEIWGDSELIVRQFNGRYQVRKEHLKPLRIEAVRLANTFDKVVVRELPRSGKENRRRNGNVAADAYATACIKAGRDLP